MNNHRSRFLVFYFRGLLMVSFFIGCHRAQVAETQENKVSMNQPQKMSCDPVNNSSSDLNQDCLLEIMRRLPLKDVFAILPPSNPILQTIIKKRIAGVWPSWFISEIEKQASLEGSDKRYVKAYLAFLKVISQLESISKQPHTIRSKSLDDILPISLLDPESTSKNAKTYLGLIGDQVVAHLNVDTKKLRVLDLQTGKTLASQELPTIANVHHIMDRVMFEKLGPNSFLLTIRYQSNSLQIHEHLTLWSWEFSPELKLIKTIPMIPMNAEINSNRKTVFRVTDTSYATFRRGLRIGDKVIDLWDVDSDMPTRSTTITSCFSVDYAAKKSQNASRDNECLQKLAENGIPIASDAFHLENGWGFGHKIDANMLMISDWDQVKISSLDYKDHLTLFKAYCGRLTENIGTISFMTKNGDFVFKMKHGYGYTNLWKIVKLELQKAE